MFILLIGVMVFVFYQFNQTPINFNPTASEIALSSTYADDYKNLQEQQDDLFALKKTTISNYIAGDSESQQWKAILQGATAGVAQGGRDQRPPEPLSNADEAVPVQ